MSVNINGTTITMTRGDTLRVKLSISDSQGRKYSPIESDKIRFAVKSSYDSPEPLIVKDIPYDTCVLHLNPKDTKRLKQPKDYVYDIQITLNDGTVDTIIPKATLKIVEEVL